MADQPQPAFMRRAIALGREGMLAGAGGPFGCVIVRAGQILAEGNNRVLASHDPTAHAEVVAIRAVCDRIGHFELRGCDLYTSCEPCPMCLGAANWARVGRIFFAAIREDAAAGGFDDEWLYREVAAPLASRRIPNIPLLRHEAAPLFQEWLAKADRTPY